VDQNVARLTSWRAFGDATGVAGQLAYDLGNAYLQPGLSLHNHSVLFRILQESPAQIAVRQDLKADKLRQTLAYIEQVSTGLSAIQFMRPDANLVRREFAWIIDMLRHACHRGLWVIDGASDTPLRRQLNQEAGALIETYSPLWLARNRPGGLSDSLTYLEKMRADYTA
jgi:hypothetical protein